MADKNLITQLARQFEKDGYTLASQGLKSHPISMSTLVKLTRDFYSYIDSFLKDFEYFIEKQKYSY